MALYLLIHSIHHVQLESWLKTIPLIYTAMDVIFKTWMSNWRNSLWERGKAHHDFACEVFIIIFIYVQIFLFSFHWYVEFYLEHFWRNLWGSISSSLTSLLPALFNKDSFDEDSFIFEPIFVVCSFPRVCVLCEFYDCNENQNYFSLPHYPSCVYLY